MQNSNKVTEKFKTKIQMYKVIGAQKTHCNCKMLGHYLNSIAKPVGSILNQRILMYEKDTLNFCWEKTM